MINFISILRYLLSGSLLVVFNSIFTKISLGMFFILEQDYIPSLVLILDDDEKHIAKVASEKEKPSDDFENNKIETGSNKEKSSSSDSDKSDIKGKSVNRDDNSSDKLASVSSRIKSLKEEREEFIKDTRSQNRTPYDDKIKSSEALQKYLLDMMDDDLF
jgi:hypothetical protein